MDGRGLQPRRTHPTVISEDNSLSGIFIIVIKVQTVFIYSNNFAYKFTFIAFIEGPKTSFQNDNILKYSATYCTKILH